jgi:MSHA biogenesis protein MshJ
MMKGNWNEISEKFAALEMREKVIVFAGLLLLTLWISFLYVIEPMTKDIAKAQGTIKTQKDEAGTTQRQIELFLGALGKDPNATINESIKNTQSSIKQMDQQLNELTVNFISPHKMREVLNELLKSDESVKVTDFTSLPAEKVGVDGTSNNTQITIYQHGIQLTVQGGYYDLQRYMKRLEALPWKFYWKSFAYTVLEHPNAKLEIEITTISTNERFIAI